MTIEEVEVRIISYLFYTPFKMNVFGGVLESACLSICLTVCPSICIQSIGNFVSQTPAAVLLMLYWNIVDTWIMCWCAKHSFYLSFLLNFCWIAHFCQHTGGVLTLFHTILTYNNPKAKKAVENTMEKGENAGYL